MPPQSKPETAEAIAYVCRRHWHQCIWLPATATHERLRVTFSTSSNFSDASLPAILFCLPMFGSRYAIMDFDVMAKRSGVRLLVIERPGLGGTTRVPIGARVDTWIESVPPVLEKLQVRHVSLLSHSAGTIYLLNTLTRLRDILDPEAPYAALLAPWVHNSHSDATLMQIASTVPTGAIDAFSGIMGFINQKVVPSVSWSGGLMSDVAGLFRSSTHAVSADDSNAAGRAEQYGVSKEVAAEIVRLQGKFGWAEDRTSGNEEAKLCLKKGGEGSWRDCDDYPVYVKMLAEQERQRKEKEPTEEKLMVKVLYAESDIMIGQGGQKYFEQCWSSEEEVARSLVYESCVLEGTNHETVITDMKIGGVEKIFENVAKAHRK